MNVKAVAVVLLFISLFNVDFFAYAQTTQSMDIHETDTVIVTAQRVPSDKTHTAENVLIYTAGDIEELPARDLGEVLSYIPAVDVQLNGNFGQSTALSINGSNARHVLLMIDGIPFNTQLSGQANPSAIPIEHIDRIEIIKGASSSAWGSSLGGVINVITKDVGDTAIPKGTFASSFAEFATTKNSLDLAGKVGKLGYFVAGSYFNTNGAQAITDTEEKKIFGKVKMALSKEAHLTGSFGYNDVEARYALRRSSTFLISQPNYTRYGKINLNVDKSHYRWNIAYKYNNQDIRTDSIRLSTGSLFSSTVSENIYNGISLVGSRDITENSTLVAGGDFEWHALKSDQLLDTGKSMSTQAPYMNYSLAWEQWDFIAGIRYDHNQRFGSQTSPSFGTVYHFNDKRQSLARAKFSRAFNAPPLLQMFNSGVVFGFTILPNLDLEAERASTYEIGFETNLIERLHLDVSGYYADIDDGIVTATVAASTTQSQNIRKLIRQGGQLLLDYRLNDQISFYGSSAFNDSFNRETDETVRDAGVARQKFTFGAKYNSGHGFGAHLAGYYNRWASAPSSQANDRKPIFDLRLTKKFIDAYKDLNTEVFLNIHNLTNSKYWSNISFPLPKRYFEGGFSVKF